MDETWINSETGNSWPAMLAKDFPQDDVFLYGYLSPMLGKASGIYEISQRMFQQFHDDGFFTNYDEIYFITTVWAASSRSSF